MLQIQILLAVPGYWLLSSPGHYSDTATSSSVFDICPDQREGADQSSTSPGYSTQHTFIVLTNLQSASPVYLDIYG